MKKLVSAVSPLPENLPETVTEDKKTSERSYADRVLCLALDIGEHIIRNGGEVARVEDTIERICTSCGAEHVEAFAITSLVVASIRMKDGSFSHQMRHVKVTEMNLFRVEKLNMISRRFCSGEIGLEEASDLVVKFKKAEPYPKFLTHFGAVLLVIGFTVFFGGTWPDAFVAGGIALIISLLSAIPLPLGNGMIKSVFLSFLSGTLAIFSVRVGLGGNLEQIIIGTIMHMIPGFAIGFSINDMVTGNIISGMMRFLQSILTAIMIVIGYGAALTLFGGV